MRVLPKPGLPVIFGMTVFTGAAAWMMVVGAAVWVVLPAVLVAVTLTVMVLPTSAVTAVYVAPVAPARFEHAPPL